MGVRHLIGVGIVLGLLLAGCGQAAAPAAPAATVKPQAAAAVDYPTMTFKAGQTSAPNGIMGLTIERFAKNMAEMSGGKVTVEVFHSGSLVTAKNELDVLAKGVVDFSSVTPAYHAGELPYFEEVTAMPFAYSYKSLPLLFQSVRPQFEKDLATYQIKLLGTMPGIFGFFVPKPLDPKNPDLSGRKLRTAGSVITTMVRHLGGSTVDLPTADVPVALRTGVVQGVVTSLSAWDTQGIMEDTPYAYYTGESVFFYLLGMSTDRYAKLPPVVQQLIDKAALATEQWVLQDSQQREAAIIKKAQSNPKIQVHEFTNDEVKAWRTKLQPVFDDFAKRHGEKGAQFMKLAEQARTDASK